MKRNLVILLLLLSGEFVSAKVKVGAERMDVLLPLLQDKKVALVVNQTSVVSPDRIHLLDTLCAANIRVMKVFAPEHGFRGDIDAGKTVENGVDKATGIPIVSIYGKNKRPTKAQLEDVDVVVFDIQDVGVRFYTYISTMHYVMEACGEYGKKVIVCDRPNPNDYVDGPVLQKELKSFVGMHPIPIVHGLTVGELASMINSEKWLKDSSGNGISCDLTVIEVQGWSRGEMYHLPIKPSPNLPNDLSIRLYPSLCFFEATNVSVGRGTTFPFQVLGSTNKKYGSFQFTPVSLKGWDTAPLHQNKVCFGLDLRTEESDSSIFTLRYLLDFYQTSGLKGTFFTRPHWFDLLSGNKQLRQQIVAGMDEETIRNSWEPELNEYKILRKKYLIY